MKKKIKTKDVKGKMVLAESVVLSNGYVLMTKGSVITPEEAQRLENKGIDLICVLAEDGVYKNTTDKVTEEIINPYLRPKSLESTVKFTEFKRNYDKQVDVAKEKMNDFLDGKKVEVEEFFNVTEDILNKFHNKSEIFSYMVYLKNNEEYTYNHCVNVSLLCNAFAQWCEMDEEEIKNLTVAGLLHDIGKILIDPKILNKKGKLTEDEYREIKQHTLKGYNMIIDCDLPEDVKNAALMHHEKLDGSGYPLGLQADEISKFAKIVAICDIYEAMTAERCYHKRICPFEVIKDFEESRYGSLDTEYLLIFIKNIAYNYLGSDVLLSDDKYAKVVFINNKRFSRPIIKCGDEYIDLLKVPELKIKEIV